MIIARILTTILLLCLGLMAPWWLFFIAIIISFIAFPWYIEAVIVALFLDTAFSSSVGFGYWYAIIVGGMFCGVWIIRKYFLFT